MEPPSSQYDVNPCQFPETFSGEMGLGWFWPTPSPNHFQSPEFSLEISSMFYIFFKDQHLQIPWNPKRVKVLRLWCKTVNMYLDPFFQFVCFDHIPWLPQVVVPMLSWRRRQESWVQRVVYGVFTKDQRTRASSDSILSIIGESTIIPNSWTEL